MRQYLVWRQYATDEQPCLYFVGLDLWSARQQVAHLKNVARDGYEQGFKAGYRLMTEADWAQAETEGTAGHAREEQEVTA